MKQYWLNEDKRLPKFSVIYSKALKKQIAAICEYNRGNIEGLDKLKEYFVNLESYISNPVIAWGYTQGKDIDNRRFINALGYNVGFCVLIHNATHLPFVFVFMIKLNLEDFGLKSPSIKEHVRRTLNRIITEYKSYTTMNTTKKKKVVRLTESDLHSIIKQCVNEALNELDWKTYANAAKKRKGNFKTDINNGKITYDDIKNGKYKGFRDLENSAINSFNNQYAYKDNDIDVYGTLSPNDEITLYGDNDFQKFPWNSLWHNSKGDLRYKHNGKTTRGDREKVLGKGTIGKEAFDTAAKELDDYNKGNYEYQRGKGWQLKKNE